MPPRHFPFHSPFEHVPPRMFQRRRYLFGRFFLIFVPLLVSFFVGLAFLVWLLVRLVSSNPQMAAILGAGSCILALMFPSAILLMARRAFRSIGAPLVSIMDAADSVAEGNLNVQVPEHFPAEFGRLARTFNRMTRELKRADEQRRHLTADVAHELRTPLHIIQGNLEGILDGVYQPTPEHIGVTLEETRLLARLVEDLQTLSLAEAGQLALKHTPVDVGELLADIQTSFSGQAEAAGVALKVILPAGQESIMIMGDIDRLNQVLSNLVANALRYTSSGGQITLTAESIQNGIRLQVSDTGTGIPPEDLPYIFDRFWRSDQSRSHLGGAGSGLGLAISRQLVQAHGGSIQVESQLGHGTLFTIELPQNGKEA